MNILQGAALGVVQGLTEFLPVSSSGHLAVMRRLVGAGVAEDVGFEVAVHAATLLAVIVFYRQRIREIAICAARRETGGVNWLVWLFIGSIPAGVLGLAIKDSVAELFSSIALVGVAWLFTAVMLLASDWLKVRRLPGGRIGWLRAVIVGVGQAVALVPGVSRSGATIAAGILTGVERRTAVEFAFLLSLPSVGGATLLTIPDWLSGAATFTPAHIAGGVTAGLSGYLAISVLLEMVAGGRLYWFAIYCAAAGVTALALG